MSNRYVEPRATRHREELVDGVQQVRIPIRRQWAAIAFLPFWLGGWTLGGIMAMRQLASAFDWFLVFWLGGWMVGLVFAAATLIAQIGGSEIVRVRSGDLEVSNGVGPLRRTWRYRGSAITNLMGYDPDGTTIWGRQTMEMPFFFRPKTGAVKFDYGSETIYLGSGIQEPEGRMIAAWIAKRLPASVTAV